MALAAPSTAALSAVCLESVATTSLCPSLAKAAPMADAAWKNEALFRSFHCAAS